MDMDNSEVKAKGGRGQQGWVEVSKARREGDICNSVNIKDVYKILTYVCVNLMTEGPSEDLGSCCFPPASRALGSW